MKYLYIVAAAGTGKRMGMKKPKQFLEYGNEPIFIKTLKVIENSKKVDEIIVVTGEEFIEKVEEYCKTFKIKKLVNFLKTIIKFLNGVMFYCFIIYKLIICCTIFRKMLDFLLLFAKEKDPIGPFVTV